MIHLFTAINWVSVFVAFVCYFFLASLWYMQLFKKQYLKSLGRENDKQQSTSLIYIIGPAICSLVITITSAILIYALGVDSYQAAFEFAMIVGLGYLFANTVNIGINPNIPKPILYGIISGAFHLVGIFIVSMVLYAMK